MTIAVRSVTRAWLTRRKCWLAPIFCLRQQQPKLRPDTVVKVAGVIAVRADDVPGGENDLVGLL